MKPFDLRAGPNGRSGGVAGKERGGREETYRYGEALRQRNTEERIIAGKPTTLRRPTLCPSRPSVLPPPTIPAKRSRYLLLEETFCSEHSVILRTVESCDYSEPIDDTKSRPRSCDSRHLARFGSLEGERRENLHFRFCIMHKYICISHLFSLYISIKIERREEERNEEVKNAQEIFEIYSKLKKHKKQQKNYNKILMLN